MKQNVILSGACNSYMRRLKAEFKKEGHNIVVGAEKADMLIFCIDPEECGQCDYKKLMRNYELYALGLLNTVNAYLPLMKGSGSKRLCFVTDLRSSINCVSGDDHWERIIAASCNMAIRILFNRLAREGFTFRVFGVDDFAEDSASYAMDHFLQDRSLEEESDLHSDEKRLVLRDKYEREYAW